MKINKNINMFVAQFFKVLQFFYIVLTVAIIADSGLEHFPSLWYLFGFVTFMVILATICGQVYMYFYEKAMIIDLPEPDDVSWK